MPKVKTYSEAQYKALEKSRDDWQKACLSWSQDKLVKRFGSNILDVYIAGIFTPIIAVLCLILFWVAVHIAMWIGS